MLILIALKLFVVVVVDLVVPKCCHILQGLEMEIETDTSTILQVDIEMVTLYS